MFSKIYTIDVITENTGGEIPAGQSLYEFHISRESRDKYNFNKRLFALNGNVIFADFSAVREFTAEINKQRPVGQKIKPGEVNAVGLIDEIYHFLFREYEEKINRGAVEKALFSLEEQIGKNKVDVILNNFLEQYPPVDVYNDNISIEEYLNGSHENRSNRVVTLEEIILFYFLNLNNGAKNLKELFDENRINDLSLYRRMISSLDSFFKNESPIGPENKDLFGFFMTPLLNHPENLEDQLDYIFSKWKIMLTEKYTRKLLSSRDLIKEDVRFDSFGGGGGPAPTIVPQYKGKMENAEGFTLGKSLYNYAKDAGKSYEEPERFTPDLDWMPRVVLLAKNAFVWLDQLSKKYGRHIHRLDQVPDEELDTLARWNFTGLWLIGIWERSPASRRIKHIMGNIDAVASAYSLYDYEIASDLGGEEAYDNLNRRAKQRGLRLASDMVPNHTGIFSKWVQERPDYFIQTNHPPFPGYSFNGEDLSSDPNFSIQIEDGYYRQTDAAVVFKRVDKRTGETRYIYHGNDGTNMPWNDTAQLNMLKSEVREAVIQKIFDVARKFSIIRFDAAMTLAKKHFARLWYPQPGMGGDIPSRADHAMTREEFDAMFPVEFWREVVDRINSEMPDTLLLAEAFWLLEGYFVRTLGMHRVYNSAFMHMMMKEENEKYRDLITNTLEFEPEILKRYVNFMSNPDEETAIRQFGSDDKYFGVALLMVTLPGLPMFGHGQVEGYTEKYGMEYKRAYYNENPNQLLIERHEREIFPLMQKRYLFSQVVDFWFFDFIDEWGNLNENVFAFTNKHGGEKALVFYNNKYEQSKGYIYRSTPKLVAYGNGEKYLKTITLDEALDIKKEDNFYYIFRDKITGLEYLKPGRDITMQGFFTELQGFKYKVFTDFREVWDDTGKFAKLAEKIGGNGVPDIYRKIDELVLEPVHDAFTNMFEEETVHVFIDNFITDYENADIRKKEKFLYNKYYYFLNQVRTHFNMDLDLGLFEETFKENVRGVGKLNKKINDDYPPAKNILYSILHGSVKLSGQANYHDNVFIYLTWLVITSLKEMMPEEGEINKRNYVEKLRLDTPVKSVLRRLGRGETDLFREVTLLNVLFDYGERLFTLDPETDIELDKKPDEIGEFLRRTKSEVIADMIEDDYVKSYLGANYYEGIWYYSKENFEDLLDWILTLSLIRNIVIEAKADVPEEAETAKTEKETEQSRLKKTASGEQGLSFKKRLERALYLINYLKDISDNSGYRLEVLRDHLLGNNGHEETTGRS